MTEKLDEVEKLHILKVLEETEGNKTKTAELLGIGLTTLYRKLKEYKIE
jgi:transcriptional regulator with PAS, ATPase and Fis domain